MIVEAMGSLMKVNALATVLHIEEARVPKAAVVLVAADDTTDTGRAPSTGSITGEARHAVR